MELEIHEKMILQMLREVQSRGYAATGTAYHVNFLLRNRLMARGRLVEANGSQTSRIRYTLTQHGEGMLHHLINKYEKELLDEPGKQDATGCSVGEERSGIHE